jgi:hypothetical protein
MSGPVLPDSCSRPGAISQAPPLPQPSRAPRPSFQFFRVKTGDSGDRRAFMQVVTASALPFGSITKR